jgi:hypothetical protein
MSKKLVMTLAEMAKMYGVSPIDFEKQIESNEGLKSHLEKGFFNGNHFYPKHQVLVFKYLGDHSTFKSHESMRVFEERKFKWWPW